MAVIEYKHTKEFQEEEIEELFPSVQWFSGNFPDRLTKALRRSSRVISSWDGDRLVGQILECIKEPVGPRSHRLF